jgi:hypothetical protein
MVILAAVLEKMSRRKREGQEGEGGGEEEVLVE